jgi:hypothetical protein
MALRVAVANGNWSNPAIWNNGVLPVAGDIVASNGFTVTIDQDINVDRLTNVVQSPVIITANMTSNTTPSGIVTSSSQFGAGYPPWQAFQYVNTGDWLSSGPVGWIAYEFPTSKVVAKYTVLRSVNNQFPTSTPRDWTLEGWTGSSWVILDTVTGNSGDYTADVSNTTAYIQYRLNITANNGGSYIGIREIFFYETNDFGANSVAGGGFILNDGVTVNANLTGGAVDLITYSGSTSANINGNLLIGTGNYVVNFNSSLGTLNIVGNLQNNGTSGRGILVNNTGTINLVGDIFTSGGNYHQQIFVQANATINITGNINAFPNAIFSSQTMIHLNSQCTLNVVGNIEYLSNNATSGRAIGINTLNCTVNITGSVYGGRQPGQQVINSNQPHFLSIIGTIYSDNFSVGPSVFSSSVSAVNLFSGPFICSEYGFFPYLVLRMHLIPSASSYIEFRDETTGGASAPAPAAPPTQLISPSAIVGNLPVTDVRFGTTYALGSLTGTLNMPHPNNVSFGTPVDNTFGNLVLTVGSIWNHPVEDITVQGSIGMRLKNVSTPQTTGEQLEAFLRLD